MRLAMRSPQRFLEKERNTSRPASSSSVSAISTSASEVAADTCSTPQRSRRLPSEQYDACDEHERCQGRGDQPTQPRLARLGAQMQKTLSPHDVGRKRPNEEDAACRPVTQVR